MLNRRTLIQNGLATAALSALPVSALLASHSSRPAIGIVDLDLSEADRMQYRFAREVFALHAFKADPGRLWVNIIEPQLRLQAVAIAGFTSASTLFALQYLSRDYGLCLDWHAAGTRLRAATAESRQELIDLNDPNYKNGNAAYSWLLAPKRG